MTDVKPYILVADDDPDDQEMLVERFHRRNPDAGFRLMANGFETLEYLRNCPNEELPRLIVIDYKMPGMTGAEVLKIVREEGRLRHIPKVVWSTSSNQEYIDKALNSGADVYFTKPLDMVSFDKLVVKLNELFKDGKESLDEN
ncbi:MAG TPA: response regulator [Puia sp.]|nr:response regulator [Puia sp.]